jgi:hypothetical protein
MHSSWSGTPPTGFVLNASSLFFPRWSKHSNGKNLHLTEECRSQLLSMSAATADRLLSSQRKLWLQGLSTTRAGTLLKQKIPIRTFQQWNETRPGFLEADLVAHCGMDIEGGYLYTLTLTDVASGWTECLPLLLRSQETVLIAIQRARLLFPFPILGIDTHNGGEFINEVLIAYCEQEHLTFTRGRPSLKNDQCFVEQKNGAIVRQVVGYDRLVGEHAYHQLTELYRALRLYVNCFQPSMKMLSNQRDEKKVRYVYDPAKTPLQRLLLSGVLPAEKQHELNAVAQSLDPVRLFHQLEKLQKALFRCAVEGNPFVANASSLPIRVFAVEQCRTELCPVEGSIPDPSGRLAALNQEQEKRKRVLGWRRSHKDPFQGEWERITSWLVANPEREPRRHFPGATASLPRTLSTTANPHAPARDEENTSQPGSETVEDEWQTEMIHGASPPPASSAARPTRIS